MKKVVSIILSCVVFTGCATSSKNLTASYVSPFQYQNYTCEQLAQESAHIQARVSEIGGSVDSRATKDKWVTGASLVLFCPALFFIGGNKAQEAEFSRLKGEHDALQRSAIQKNCIKPAATLEPAK